MKLLLDTGTWIWSVGPVQKLNQTTRDLLSDPKQELYFSAVSAWEVAIKAGLGKLHLPEPPRALVPKVMARLGLQPLPITHLHALEVYDLPSHHRDPFDRLLIAQARLEGLTLVTADYDIQKYDVRILWAGQ